MESCLCRAIDSVSPKHMEVMRHGIAETCPMYRVTLNNLFVGGGWGGVIVDVQIRAVIVILGFKTLNWNPIGQ